MHKKTYFATMILVIGIALSTVANASELSRKWEHHFWIHEHTDLSLQVFHLPNGAIRALGRFSNGLQTVDRTITANIVVKNTDGEA